MKTTFRIAEISLGRSHWDTSYSFEFSGHQFDVQRFGANFSIDTVKSLITSLRNQVDAFAINSLPPTLQFDDTTYVHRQYIEVMNIPSSVPLCDGKGLKELSNLSNLKRFIDQGKIDPSLGVFFPAASMNVEIEEFIRKSYRSSVYIGDAYSLLGIPLVVKPFLGLKTISKLGLTIASMKDIKGNTPLVESKLQKMTRASFASQVENIQYVVADLPFLLLFDTANEFLRGKDLITWGYHPVMEKEIAKYGPRRIINLFPDEFKVSPYMNYAVLDAALRLVHERTAPLTFNEWEDLLHTHSSMRGIARPFYLKKSESTQAKVVQSLHKVHQKFMHKETPDFAFVVHALSHKDLLRVPGFSVFKHMPSYFDDPFDRLISKAPPIVYGEVNHVISENTGKEVNGLIYGLFSTPKVMKEADPEVIYRKIEHICQDAAHRGAKLIGLGAYTKVIGDSGITINENSIIPVTTGNSLSASATLWGLADVVQRMQLLSKDPQTGRVQGMAMVIGATGSIGKVSAKLLSLVFKKVCLVAPRINRLQELQDEIRKISPLCEVIIATDANELARKADVLVTATSAFDTKIVDVMNLKPGCVVCDCSRPLDFTIEDAKKRPDILIMESGELLLPGPTDLTCSLGLPGKAVYACLAETAVLALEERYESFTLGRDIEWNKVREIYRLSRKHGVKLAAIQGHMGVITDKEIQLTRELALLKLGK